MHFKSGLQGAGSVIETADKLKQELNSLHGVLRQQRLEHEAAIDQVEQYQQVTFFTKYNNYTLIHISV